MLLFVSFSEETQCEVYVLKIRHIFKCCVVLGWYLVDLSFAGLDSDMFQCVTYSCFTEAIQGVRYHSAGVDMLETGPEFDKSF